MKRQHDDFALFGGAPVFAEMRSISNLVCPDFKRFLGYSRAFFERDGEVGRAHSVALLEERLAAYHQVPHCVAVCGGFWGLVLAIRALALPGRHEVVMPSLTYRRLADVVAWAGFTPHLVEVDPRRLAISPDTARSAINADTALLLGVHPIVNCCDAAGLERLAQESGLPLLFDAVESSYETCTGRRVGGFGDAECFSMQSSKLLNAAEGGYVTTRDGALATRLRHQRELAEGVEASLDVRQIGVHAALALAALDGVDQQVEANRRRYLAYRAALPAVSGLRLLEYDERDRHGYKNIVVELKDDWPLTREQTVTLLHAENMLVRPYYFPPLHEKVTGYPMRFGDLSQSSALARRYLLLPCGFFMRDGDVERVVEFLVDLARHGSALRQRVVTIA